MGIRHGDELMPVYGRLPGEGQKSRLCRTCETLSSMQQTRLNMTAAIARRPYGPSKGFCRHSE